MMRVEISIKNIREGDSVFLTNLECKEEKENEINRKKKKEYSKEAVMDETDKTFPDNSNVAKKSRKIVRKKRTSLP
jgi:hypothetical protein